MVDRKMAQRSSTHRGIVLSSIDLPVKLLKTQKTQIENSEKMRRTFFHRFLRSGAETQRVHDYRIRQVRDLELRLPYRRRRYVCLVCGKRFAEKTFDIRLSNRFTDGCNNAIKTLKRLAFGFRLFTAFRARILLTAWSNPHI